MVREGPTQRHLNNDLCWDEARETGNKDHRRSESPDEWVAMVVGVMVVVGDDPVKTMLAAGIHCHRQNSRRVPRSSQGQHEVVGHGSSASASSRFPAP